MMLSKTPFLLLAIFVATLTLKQSTGDLVFVRHLCFERGGNYTHNSTFHHNLGQVLSDLETNSTFSPSHETISGDSPLNQVSGRYYCRHDLSLRVCSACVQAATEQIVANCSSSGEAIILYEECTLLYHNYSATVDYDDLPTRWVILYSPVNVTNPSKFYVVLAETMNRIVNESAYGGDGFATGEGNVTEFEKVYCLAQCSPFITGLSCERCLRKALVHVDACCTQYVDVEFFYPNCQLRYSSVEPFYDVYTPLISPSSFPIVMAPTPAFISASTPSDSPLSANRGVTRSSGECFKLVIVLSFTTLLSLLGKLVIS